MSPRLAILDDYQRVALTSADWSIIQAQTEIDVFHDTLHSEDELASRLQPYTIICAMRERTKFPSTLLSRLPNLKLLVTTGPHNRSIDLKAAKELGITVSRTEVMRNVTVEHVWALILATMRNVIPEHLGMKEKSPVWQRTVPQSLKGRTLGLIGLGWMGTRVAKIGLAFEMNVVAWSPHLTAERAAAAGAQFSSSKEDLIRVSDILSLQIVYSESTHHLITASDFALMKPTAFFINTSRGPIADEQALINVLKEKRIKGAALDVYDVEPLPLDHPLRELDNVTLSPHIAYVSEEHYKLFYEQTVEDVVAFLSGEPLRVIS